jgi:RNA polymerase sigma factor (sigma-70 family)
MGTISPDRRAAFEVEFTAVFSALMAHAKSKLRHVQDAEDLVSRAALKAWRAWPNYQDQGHFSAWIHSILANEIMDFHRENNRRIPAGYDPDAHENSQSCPPAQEAHHACRDAARAINELAPAQRTALTRIVIDGEAEADVAADLDVARKTVRVNLHRARKNLRRAVS